MATIRDYETWKAKQPAIPAKPGDYPIAHLQQTSLADRACDAMPHLLALLAAILLCWFAWNAKSALIYGAVRAVVAWKAISRFFDDVRQQVNAGVAAHAERAERPRIRAERASTEPSRFALAGRMFFNLSVAPLLLGVALAGIVWIVSLITG